MNEALTYQRKYDTKQSKDEKLATKMLNCHGKRDEISKRSVKHANKNIKYTTKYQTKRIYDEHIEHGCTKPMTKPQ